MKVVCDNCRAVYKVPGEKLTKAVNKATCRNCGHRMLIPRPKPNADPEERTLVTAVPPTPVGAPPRSHVQEDREHTIPSRPPRGNERGGGHDDVRMDTPMASPRIGDTVPAPEEGGYEPAPRGRGPSEQTTVKPQQPGGRGGRSSVPPASQTASQTPAGQSRRSIPSAPPPPEPRRPSSAPGRATPAPAPARAREEEDVGGIDPSYESPRGRGPSSLPPAAQPPATRRTPAAPPVRAPRNTPAPAPSRSPASANGGGAALAAWSGPPPHDPAGDLNWALLGTTIALFGGFLLSILSIWNNPLIMWFGLAMTFGGGILSFLVLLTGARGRRPAQTLLSAVLGLLIAMFVSTFLVGTKLGAERVIDAYDITFSNVGLTAGTATPAVAPAPQPQPIAAQPAPVDGQPTEPQPAGAEPIPVPVPVPGRPPAPQPPPRPQPPSPPPAPQPGRPPQPAPQPAPAPMPPPAPPPVPGMMQTVPVEVIHTIVSNNIEVKRCFVPLFQAGTLPNRVDAQFTIAPSGRANGAVLVQPAYRGSALESCLSRAISGLSFPPTVQGTSANYPFILQ